MEGSRSSIHRTEGHLPLGGKSEGLLPPTGMRLGTKPNRGVCGHGHVYGHGHGHGYSLVSRFLPPSLLSLISIYSRPSWSDFPLSL
jgi:hypothetical protein